MTSADAAWTRTRLTELLGIRYPIIQAPMAGSTTPELVAAVCEAGALGSLGGARMTPDELRAAIRGTRALTSHPFAVNLFAAPAPVAPDPDVVGRVRAVVAEQHARLGITADGPAIGPPPFTAADQLEVVVQERVPVFSFTFGIPDLDAVRAGGATLLGTATTTREAVLLEDAGVDAVVLQGAEAGGHRGTFAAPFERSLVGLAALVPQAAAAVSVPVVAAGAIMNGAGIAAALALGADGAQLGTAFLTCDESTAADPYKDALAHATDDGSAVTARLTGRPARAVRTSLLDALEATDAVAPFGVQAQLLEGVYAEGRRRGDPELMPMLAGQAAGLARRLPAARLVGALVEETDATIARLSGGS